MDFPDRGRFTRAARGRDRPGHRATGTAAGPGVGGFLNATFGNAAELIIAVIALRQGHIALVKASITGSIIGNLLLVLGLSCFVGGLGRRSQKFNRTAATNATAVMLFLAVVALVMPAVFDLALFGSLAPRPPAIDRLSVVSAFVLIVAYAGSLIYAFMARRDLFRPTRQGAQRASRICPLPAAIVCSRWEPFSPPSRRKCSSARSNRRSPRLVFRSCSSA